MSQAERSRKDGKKISKVWEKSKRFQQDQFYEKA